MKILLINSEYPPVGGGAGNASANIARHLSGLGHEVRVLTSGYDDLPDDEQCEGVHLLRTSTRRRRPDRSTAWEQVSFMWAAAFHAVDLCRRDRPDVTLAFFGLPSGAVAWLLKRTSSIPYVVSLRGGDVPGFRPYDFRLYHKLAAPFLRIIWHNAQAVIANSRGLHDLAAAFDPSVQILIIPNGVDLEKFQAPARDWSRPHILSVGRVVYQKGYDLALRALAALRDLQWEWWIAGDGPQMPALRSMALGYGLQDRVHFLGWQRSADLKSQYAHANLFLFPSRHEGMPNAVLEAMASGLPVAASRIAGSEELVVDGGTGLLFPPDDPLALEQSLRTLLVQPHERERMGKAARRRVEASYDWKVVAERYQSVLEEALK